MKDKHKEIVIQDFQDKIHQWDRILQGKDSLKFKYGFIYSVYSEYEEFYHNYLFGNHDNEIVPVVWPLVKDWANNRIKNLGYIDLPELNQLKKKIDRRENFINLFNHDDEKNVLF